MQWKELLCPDRIRSYHKKNSSDLRSEYEKDYHRIIGSASFRRLQDKTQVFPLDQSDFVRTRLTHSLEVSSFCKSLGQSVGRSIRQVIRDPEFTRDNETDICDILQCAGLLHDIGNPPFGHFGETAIRSYFEENLSGLQVDLPEYGRLPLTEVLSPQMQSDFYHFEGNAQALRLVTKLHYLVDEHGMNLTKALLATIIKYPVSSQEIDKNGPVRAHKMGYFYADRDVFEDVERSCGLNGARHPLTFLLEAADDTAYHTADIEDAFRKGFLSFHELLRELEADCGPEDALPEGMQPTGLDSSEAEPPRSAFDGCSAYRRCIENLKRLYRKGLNKGMRHPDDYAIQNWAVAVQGEMLAAVSGAFIDHYDAIMNGTFDHELIEGTEADHINRRLGKIAEKYVFKSRPIITIEISADKILSYLLDRFVHAALYYDTGREMTPVDERLMALISENYKAIYQIYSEGKDPGEKLYLRLMLVTDYICGMTDSYARDLYCKLSGFPTGVSTSGAPE